MITGAMNHPARDIFQEIEWVASLDFDFIDLTLEPPAAVSWKVDASAIRRALDDYGLSVVGHTAYYLPIASPFESLRRAAVDELAHCIEIFSRIGARWVNFHPDGHSPFEDSATVAARNVESIRALSAVAKNWGVGLMVENIPMRFNTVNQLAPLLEAVPELGLHLDIGHCHLGVEKNTTEELLTAYGTRLRHVHLHDNKGGTADLHLPLGAGTLPVARCVQALRHSGYNGSITLEVFSSDSSYIAHSRDLLRQLWQGKTPQEIPPRARLKESISV